MWFISRSSELTWRWHHSLQIQYSRTSGQCSTLKLWSRREVVTMFHVWSDVSCDTNLEGVVMASCDDAQSVLCATGTFSPGNTLHVFYQIPSKSVTLPYIPASCGLPRSRDRCYCSNGVCANGCLSVCRHLHPWQNLTFTHYDTHIPATKSRTSFP